MRVPAPRKGKRVRHLPRRLTNHKENVMIGGGFAHKTCNCEDFPCCGHNDVDPNWEPDPNDFADDFYEDDEW